VAYEKANVAHRVAKAVQNLWHAPAQTNPSDVSRSAASDRKVPLLFSITRLERLREARFRYRPQ